MRTDPTMCLAEILGTVGGDTEFSARRTAPTDDLNIEIVGVGPLELPVSAAAVKHLRSVARPARYGLGEQTLVDSQVRDTWELPKSRVRIDRRRWNKTLKPMLTALGADLGLPDTCRLRAELHSVLLYEKGQFFLPHKDSEKVDSMVGTLVVTLPSTCRGGELVVRHGGREEMYRSSNRLLSFVAFYADCEHELLPVTSGHRVALTYNLSLHGDPSPAEVDATLVGSVSDCLRTYFESNDRLVYLLDHEYTERGLSFGRLKGVDAGRVAALCEAARQRDDEILLALAEVHETRECYESYSRSRWHRYDDEYDDADPASAVEVGEVIDGSTSLGSAIDSTGAAAEVGAPGVHGDELCATTPSADLQPYSSEYEGYMGNYGNTMDRWYRRGAVVIWPRSRSFVVRAQGSSRWAVGRLQELLDSGELAMARECARSLEPFWATVSTGRVVDGTDEASLTVALRVADGIDDAGLAAMLLSPFGLRQVSSHDAPGLVTVAAKYRTPWFRRLLREWHGARRTWLHQSLPDEWIAELPTLCRALDDCDGRAVAAGILEVSATTFFERLQQSRAVSQPSRRTHALNELARPAAGLLVAASIVDDADVGSRLSATLAGEELIPCVIAALRHIGKTAPDELTTGVIGDLVGSARTALTDRVAVPLRDPDDWSISWADTCACERCVKFRRFLTDRERRRLEWPLAEAGRRHIESQIDQREVPVEYATRRSGRPYTLVLIKTSALFDEERRARDVDEIDLDWLATLAVRAAERDGG